MHYPESFEVIVIGGGHAGTEAALAAARMGCKTLLLTHNIETLGQMSCNPAIGGIGKGHLVKEIDALGGFMAQAIDHAGIQFRTLNASKGPAVRATRAQADRELYKRVIRNKLESEPNLAIFQQSVDDLIISNDRINGVVTQMGLQFFAPRVVLTVGTFLGGRIHIGLSNHQGGRAGDPPSNKLAEKLRALPFRVERLKTGTPPRIDAKSVNFEILQEQKGDSPVPVFSYLGHVDHHPQQISCYITHTNAKTHEIIRAGLDRSPMYSGVIEGVGPRYCPSVEDKVVRFADRSSHQIFVEPEGLNSKELYPNGISTSLPFDVQYDFVRSIKGFENAHITRPGYAIEYDYFDPRDLKSSLETKFIAGLFFAGQINGTTGYEEAAAQGLVAGMNAAAQSQEKEVWSPRRDQAYIGVLIDDLVTRGTNEPYRMFTSRAEYRLNLREDNADLRLTKVGRDFGLVDDFRWRSFESHQNSVVTEQQRLNDTWVHPKKLSAEKMTKLFGKPLSRESKLIDLLKRPEISYCHLVELVDMAEPLVDSRSIEQIEIQARYSGYIDRQEIEIKRLQKVEAEKIPNDFDYKLATSLSNEVRQKLALQRPETIGQASRISGVTPAAVSLLLVYLKKYRAKRKAG